MQEKQGMDAVYTCTTFFVIRKRRLYIHVRICVYFCLHHKEITEINKNDHIVGKRARNGKEE